jgi:hypothetical protein
MSDQDTQTKPGSSEFDFSAHPYNTLFHERRTGRDRRDDRAAPAVEPAAPAAATTPSERRQKKDRRRRIDPTTFDKQYTDDEMEFMNAMQRFKEQTGRAFPSHGEVLQVAARLGYRREVIEPVEAWDETDSDERSPSAQPTTVDV